ncbi:MAG: hypothetical protein M3O62_02550 [Pseudomonadota bacterium]|nr:hypothetical protein [Pseudomonadota bacterium]
MMIKQIFQTTLIAAFLVGGLSGCQADADGSANGGLNGNGTNVVNGDDGIDDQTGEVEGTDGDAGTIDNDDNGIPNSVGTPGLDDVNNQVVTDDGTGTGGQTDVAGGDSGMRFLCRQAFDGAFGAETTVGADGLVGGPLTDLLDMLGGDSATNLTNSVTDAEYAIDADLRTASVFTLTASLLGTAIDTIDQNVYAPDGASIAAGKYAVAAVSFPQGLANVGLLTDVTVTTYMDDTALESTSFDATAIDLLGIPLVGDPYAMIGLKVSQPYNRVSVSLSAGLLAVDVSEAMFLHEVCTDGVLVAE